MSTPPIGPSPLEAVVGGSLLEVVVGGSLLEVVSGGAVLEEIVVRLVSERPAPLEETATAETRSVAFGRTVAQLPT